MKVSKAEVLCAGVEWNKEIEAEITIWKVIYYKFELFFRGVQEYGSVGWSLSVWH